MLIFAILQAFTPYLGVGGGFVRSKRTIKNILDYNKTKKEFEGDIHALSMRDEKDEEKLQILVPHINNDSKLQRGVVQNGFLGKVFVGASHSICSLGFLGLEVYGGYQRAVNDYFKNGLFLGAQVLGGVNMPHGIQGAIGFGLDASNHISKAIDGKNENDKRYFHIQTVKINSSEHASYWSVAPCLNVMLSKDLTKNIALRLEAQFVFPKEKRTSEIQYRNDKKQTSNQFKIDYRSSQQRYLLSLMMKF